MQYVFGDYTLEPRRRELRCQGHLVSIQPQVFDVLVYLVTHRDRAVPKQELQAQLWPHLHVSPATLSASIKRAHQAVGDGGAAQRVIQTLHGRGYRFVAPVEECGAAPLTRLDQAPAPGAVLLQHRATPETIRRRAPTLQREPDAVQVPASDPPLLVGRAAELAHLHQCFAQAHGGQRQLVMITGEPGIGKTALVDAFLHQVAACGSPPDARHGAVGPAPPPARTPLPWIGRGQCIEHFGAGEAYLPILEALGRLGRQPDGAHITAVLRQQAPTWLVQLPALLRPPDLEALQHRVLGATPARMLRELADALEALTAEVLLVLVLEDLHWSDTATVTLLAHLAHRPEPARLLVLGTYRPVEVIMRAHPLHGVTQELQVHGRCAELPLDGLSAAAVAEYLALRFPGWAPQPVSRRELARVLHQHTEGNPLFLVTVVQDLVARGLLVERAGHWVLTQAGEAVAGEVPQSLRQLIEQHLERLPAAEQQVLEAGSVAGVEFAAAAVAAGVRKEVEEVEQRCAHLVRGEHFLRASGMAAWPDGTVSGRYSFRHALYQRVLYERVAAAGRRRLHQRIGERVEGAYGDRVDEVAAELAMHFEQGRDYGRAVQYLRQGGENALRRSAHVEAIHLLTQGLEVLKMLPDTPERAQQELDLQITLGPALVATKGTAAPEVEQTYARARALCARVSDTPRLFPTLRGLCRFYRNKGALLTARDLGEQLVRLAQRETARTPRLEAYEAHGPTLFYLGEYPSARTHFEQGIALIDPAMQRALAHRRDEAPGVVCLAFAANTLWCLGYPTQAVRRSQEALALAQELAHPYSLAFAHNFVASLHHRRRDVLAVQAQAEALRTLATAQGFPLLVGYGACWRGWALTMQGQGAAGLVQIHQGLAAIVATGQTLSRPRCLSLLAEAAGHVGQVKEGLCLTGEALTAFKAHGYGDLLAEVYRIQGELLLRQAVPDVPQAEACFQQALAIACRQHAKSWELRAALSLSRLWQRQGKRQAASDLLTPIYGWFTEGFDTADLQEAGALLAALA
jgi:predicted ATPase/DNA-binding winged helix-turn-helix (wHTH) protein